MSRIKLLFVAVVTASLIAGTATSAFAIWIELQSASVPLSNDYPEYARQQIWKAFETENCDFIDGHSTLRVTTLNFSGDTTAVNKLLLELANCPAASVAVSFEKIKNKCDWRIVHSVTGNKFRVIINLESNQIELEQLTIPPANGPDLKR
ncbi:hypothetical protein FF011L_11100 [Roseimaritima multifibrata]|uniref:Uncharacterized protein n=1 Tax=Roseimaritima multifibrata TaxID=1930274 RepID=A0A517MC64_9BACT|nr:hypothetical protein [Roseimaritima multifibrata]QDS92367.1 hypothetical protein FF011L_11100 [Roseimaritima multifibrata]